MLALNDLLVLIWMHFFADFILQTDKMAISKSSSYFWLFLHVTVYTLPFLWFGWQFALVTFAAHFVTDWVTSRVTKKLWEKEERHWFFVVIGVDQALHMTALVVAWAYFQ